MSKKRKSVKISPEEIKDAIDIIEIASEHVSDKSKRLIKKFLKHYEELQYFYSVHNYMWMTEEQPHQPKW